MTSKRREAEPYNGFEQGPIRPPSEANSLLIRVTRNCPWNHCTFCPVYKKRRFSLRPKAHVIEDIEAVYRHVSAFESMADTGGRVLQQDLNDYLGTLGQYDFSAFQAAVQWYGGAMRSIFLQDANSLIIKPEDLIEILEHLQRRFPGVDRITSYARSHTIARISDDHLAAMRRAGLSRIHIGMESGSDEVLKRVRKGVDKATQIKAGRKVKQAGMELSEYLMPGLGGRALSRLHATESADALNQIDPDFIRLRTLALPGRTPLAEEHRQGRFEKCTDLEMAAELRLFIASLKGITSWIKSDHILNLFEEIDGRLPFDQPTLLAVLDRFLAMPRETQMHYQVGRRLGIFHRLADMDSSRRSSRVAAFCREHEITVNNVDAMADELMKRFI
ncbi:MAG: radical SAM protein [Desulfosarcinaceae bacterium]|jgi:histone acetyltransferase (RNA polymerase elongator complex component)